MAGFLQTLFGSPDQTQALGLLGSYMMAGQSPQGFMAAQQHLAGADDRRLKRGLLEMETEARRMEIDRAKRAAANEQGLASLMPKYFNAGTPGRPGTEAVNAALPAEFQIGAQAPIAARAPQFDVNGYTAAAMQDGFMDPLSAIKLRKSLAPESQINKLDPKDFTPASLAKYAQSLNYADLERLDKLHFGDTGGGITGINPFTGAPVNTIPKSGDPFKDLVLSDGQGGMRPNSPLIGAKSQIAKSGASSVSVNTGQKGLDNELKIRGDFRSEPIYKAHQDVQAAYSQISQALKQESPAGDMAGATKIMKLLDPGSVVRESELGMAMAATGLFDRITNYAQMTLSGQKLTPQQRKDFQNLADVLYQESTKQFNAKRGEYSSLATDYGLNADRLLGPAITSPKLPTPAAGGASPAPGPGARFLGFE